MKKATIAAVLAASLTGCVAPGGGGYWDNEAHDGSAFERDKQQCIYESQRATASAPAGISQDIAAGVRQGELQQSCLRAKGYVWVTR